MHDPRLAIILLALLPGAGWAQTKAADPAPAAAQTRPANGPPPNAYADCQGKKAGAVVQHKTPEGVVEAVCADSPKGLVARPKNPPKDRPAK